MDATASTQAATGKDVRPFTIDVPEEQLDDLRRRIDATKWPDREADASQGVQLATIQALPDDRGGLEPRPDGVAPAGRGGTDRSRGERHGPGTAVGTPP